MAAGHVGRVGTAIADGDATHFAVSCVDHFGARLP
jgi:hypothetical protein